MTLSGAYRYIRVEDIPEWESLGWVVVASLRAPHGFYSALCAYPETWRPVVGYEGIYEVSSYGKVNVLDRQVRTFNWQSQTWHHRTMKSRLMSPGAMDGGYLGVTLVKESRRTKRHVSHIVAEAFIGPRPDGCDVCHGDGDVANNAAYNLRYDTRTGNMEDCILHGTLRHGERLPQSKLTNADVETIRASKGIVKQSDLAARYGVTQSNISLIQSGCTWVSEKRIAAVLGQGGAR